MKNTEKIEIITSTIKLMAGRIEELATLYKSQGYDRHAKDHDEELEDLTRDLAGCLESIGNYCDGCDILADDPKMLEIVNNAFNSLKDKE